MFRLYLFLFFSWNVAGFISSSKSFGSCPIYSLKHTSISERSKPPVDITESDAIFYPKIEKQSIKGDEQLTDDEVLYEMFLRQIAAMNEGKQSNNFESSWEINKDRRSQMPARRIVEEPTELIENMPLEIVHKKRITFCNFIRRESVNTVKVKLTSGEPITIDIGQIVSCWDTLADEDPIETLSDWAEVASDALAILGDLSSRKSDLIEFWEICSRRSNALVVDSFDLGVYIFQERHFRSWIDPLVEPNGESSGVWALSAAQRYACALLLYHDDYHFKRKPSIIPATDTNNDHLNHIHIIEGGYKVLDVGASMFKEIDVFEQYYQNRLNMIQKSEEEDDGVTETEAESYKMEPFRAGCITRYIRALELYSMSPANLVPPPAVKSLLKRLKRPFEAPHAVSAAADVLKKMKHTINRNQPLEKPLLNRNIKATYSSLTPWTKEQLEATQTLSNDMDRRRQFLANSDPGKVGKRDSSGRMDFRGNLQEHPVLCIDAKNAVFLDDAFSLSPETGEILVHVADVAAALKRFEILQETAKERISSYFLPSGPVHMLPPEALESLKLSSTQPNDVITVALSVDSESGKLIGFRVFPSIIGPVFPIDVVTADEILAGVGVSAGANGMEVSKRLGYSDAVVRDLRRTERLVSKVIEANPWVDVSFSALPKIQFALNKRSGTFEQSDVDKTPANRMINALLTMYSNATYEYCNDANIPTPLAWEQRDKFEDHRARRHATQPLRNWLSQLQQRQVRAALRMDMPLTRKECALAVSHHNSRRKMSSSLTNRGRDVQSFESFEAHCASLQATGSDVILTAEGLGENGIVLIRQFNLKAILRASVSKGEQVRVRVKKVIPESRAIFLELVS